MLGDSIVARLAEASAAGQDGIVVFFPEALEVRIPEIVVRQPSRPVTTALARRVIPADAEWSLSGLRG
ncbi:MAG: hypothetical protein KatS3mg060_2944 [Dehalococcoidia bacterium]|nr:MAG: hypothetical protein KatS3mg060_2944 [Dehalococcoidia bacterium]